MNDVDDDDKNADDVCCFSKLVNVVSFDVVTDVVDVTIL